MSEYELIRQGQIDDAFEGFDDEMVFELADGSFWIQDEYKYWYHYAYRPRVNILRKGGRLYLQVDGQNQVVAIHQITDVIKSQVNGEFKGWEGETTYKLTNGQVWQQSTYSYEYTYSYMPEVTVYSAGGGYKMRVEGTLADVRRIK